MGKNKPNKASDWMPRGASGREQGRVEFDYMRRYNYYYNRMLDIYLSRFEWHNLPDTVDPRYAELSLITTGRAIYFVEPVIGPVILKTAGGTDLNQYGVPIERQAYSDSTKYMESDLTNENSVIIFNNYTRLPSDPDIIHYASQLAQIDMSIHMNLNAQKTPLFINVKNTNQALTMKNLYGKYDGNIPVIFADNEINPDSIKVLRTDAPFLAAELYDMKMRIWDEFLTMAGVANAEPKKERLITNEMDAMMGSVRASRYSPLSARNDACKLINEMFKENIYVTFRGEGVEDNNQPYDIPDFADVKDNTDEGSVNDE